jgi:REP element-mobilizing transposase RayT
MPNHVHLLMTPLAAVSRLMQSLKRFTAREGTESSALPVDRSGKTKAMIDWFATIRAGREGLGD